MNRRTMIAHCLGAGAAAFLHLPHAKSAETPPRKFTIDLCPGRIGVAADQRATIELAAQFDFESVEPMGEQLVKMSPDEVTTLRQSLEEHQLVWGAAGLPVEFRQDQQSFRRDLNALPAIAKALHNAGVTRVGTWLSPAHDELTYRTNFQRHVQRLRAVAEVLGESQLRFGLEYVGPKTSWTARRHSFIHTMAETLELIDRIQQPNVGLVLDSWHWYTAGETLENITALSNQQVIAVDLNDAPAGIERDAQLDNRRELPAATGVIDLKTFVNGLRSIGYDGPVRAEPFNRPLNDMDDEAALRMTSQALHRAVE